MRSVPITLLIATTPRSTRIQCPDSETAKAVRALLGAKGRDVRSRGVLDPLAVDVGIGVQALGAGEVLMAAGYEFRWHAEQYALNRASTAWGLPVKE